MTRDSEVTSPKQPQAEHRRDWYPYYAGFTEAFVAEILSERIENPTNVLDPWNGSGTTTAVCAQRGVDSAGLDINPVLTIIARARLTPSSIAESLRPIGEEILQAAERLRAPAERYDDLLGTWIRRDAVARFRSVQNAIHSVLETNHSMPESQSVSELPESLPTLACFYYAALFATARDLLRRFRATNPTWLSVPPSPRNRIYPCWETIKSRFIARIEYLAQRLISGDKKGAECVASVRTGSATRLPDDWGGFDACITSPPYATRLDYVKSVLPELAVLGVNAETVAQLRRSTTGGPVVKGIRTRGDLRSETATSLVEGIKTHGSHGSRSYYYPWMSNYLRGLQDSLREIASVLEPQSPILIVVQDSHYKELHVNLQRIIIEMFAAEDRHLAHRRDFRVRHLMARMNPSARKRLSNRANCESLLEFR